MHESQGKARWVFALKQEGRLNVQNGRTGHAGLHDLDESRALEPGGSNQSESFRQSVNLERQDEVHSQLDGLSGAIRPKVEPALTQYTKDRLGFLKHLGVSAHHED